MSEDTAVEMAVEVSPKVCEIIETIGRLTVQALAGLVLLRGREDLQPGGVDAWFGINRNGDVADLHITGRRRKGGHPAGGDKVWQISGTTAEVLDQLRHG